VKDVVAWARRRRRALGLTGAAMAVAMAGLWLVVVPVEAETAVGLQEAAIRWGHPACWALLAVLGVLFAADAPKRARNGVGVAAAVCYAAFLAGMVL
jgi:hypothetical protein